MSTQFFVSLVLATIGRSDDVGRCLRTLAAQTDQFFEVLVVDQNNDDRLDVWIAEAKNLGLNVKHLHMATPSLSGARNLGIAQSSGTIIGFPDDDCWYETDVIAQLRVAFLMHEDASGMIACWVEQTASRQGEIPSGALSNTDWRQFRGGDASSISLFFKRSLFDEIQGFDDQFGIGCWYGAAEETDFILSALAKGKKILHCQQAKIHHKFGAKQTGSLSARYKNARSRSRGTGAIYAKHSLNSWIILRGLCAPLFKSIWQRPSFDTIAIGFATSFGRLEGMLRWHWRK
jgi:glycosyltransferase involved in cell wall biosynthesis